MPSHALVTGSDPALLLRYRSVLGSLGYLVESIPLDRSPERPFGLAVVDLRSQAGISRLQRLQKRALVLAVCDQELVPIALAAGADGTLGETPPDNQALATQLGAIAGALGRPMQPPLGPIIGRSLPLRKVLWEIEHYSNSDATILLLGETGTGKERFARALHDLSPRKEGPFVPVNCAAIPETLAESEIFGHVKGAFTGAKTRMGRLGAAEGGTLFLDEIGELSLALQAKLLRVLQEQEYVPIGQNQARHANVRVIAATNRDLQDEVQKGHFRSDLYWRLEVLTLDLPPLRARKEDILPLGYHFLDHTNATQNRKVTGMKESVEKTLLSHCWPGNVRELENTIERATLLRGSGLLEDEDIILRRQTPKAPGSMLSNVRLPKDGLDLQEITAALETLLIEQALEQTGGNRSQAARLLKINRTTLLEKMRRRDR